MERVVLQGYEILLWGKDDGDVRDIEHEAYRQFFSVRQTHEDNIFLLKEKITGYIPDITADSIISDHIPAGVYIADCMPIAILGKHMFAIVHVSWKTLYQEIIQKTVKKLCRHGEEVVDMFVYVGPSIRAEAYEVGEEFCTYFPHHTKQIEDMTYRCDLLGQVGDVFNSLYIGGSSMHIHSDCTYSCPDKRHSRRRDGTSERNFMGVRKLSSVSS